MEDTAEKLRRWHYIGARRVRQKYAYKRAQKETAEAVAVVAK
jgi:hypothetical protein